MSKKKEKKCFAQVWDKFELDPAGNPKSIVGKNHQWFSDGTVLSASLCITQTAESEYSLEVMQSPLIRFSEIPTCWRDDFKTKLRNDFSSKYNRSSDDEKQSILTDYYSELKKMLKELPSNIQAIVIDKIQQDEIAKDYEIKAAKQNKEKKR